MASTTQGRAGLTLLPGATLSVQQVLGQLERKPREYIVDPWVVDRATLVAGQIRSVADFADDDWRKTNPRFTGENFRRNLAIVDEVGSIGAEIGATPAQTALAWLLTRGEDIAPIPGTRRVSRVEENTAADAVELTPDQLERLNNLEPAAGDRHDESNMATIDR